MGLLFLHRKSFQKGSLGLFLVKCSGLAFRFSDIFLNFFSGILLSNSVYLFFFIIFTVVISAASILEICSTFNF